MCSFLIESVFGVPRVGLLLVTLYVNYLTSISTTLAKLTFDLLTPTRSSSNQYGTLQAWPWPNKTVGRKIIAQQMRKWSLGWCHFINQEKEAELCITGHKKLTIGTNSHSRRVHCTTVHCIVQQPCKQLSVHCPSTASIPDWLLVEGQKTGFLPPYRVQ